MATIFGACIVLLVLFATTFKVAEKVRAKGYLVPTDGWSRITASRSGLVHRLAVKSGERVRKGDLLLEIEGSFRTDEDIAVGAKPLEAIDRRRTEVGRHLASLAVRRKQAEQSAKEERELLRQRINTQSLKVTEYKTWLELATNRLHRAKQRDSNAAVAEGTLIELRDELMARNAMLATQLGTIQVLLTDLIRAEAAWNLQQQAMQVEGVSLSKELERLSMEEVTTRSEYSTLIMAPREGVASSISVAAGDWIQAGDPLLNVLPERIAFKAQLMLPSADIGQIELGQRVDIHIDGFPVERYGVQEGHITRIAESGSDHLDSWRLPPELEEPTFIVEVAFPDGLRVGDDARGSPKPGMSVVGTVLTGRPTVMAWLMKPIQHAAQEP